MTKPQILKTVMGNTPYQSFVVICNSTGKRLCMYMFYSIISYHAFCLTRTVIPSYRILIVTKYKILFYFLQQKVIR